MTWRPCQRTVRDRAGVLHRLNCATLIAPFGWVRGDLDDGQRARIRKCPGCRPRLVAAD